MSPAEVGRTPGAGMAGAGMVAGAMASAAACPALRVANAKMMDRTAKKTVAIAQKMA